jgi:hypothetical protein
MDAGDVIYYDWNPQDGATDHTVMETGYILDANSTPLISSHNPDLNLVRWDNWMATSLRPFGAHLLRVRDTFTY